MRVVSLDPRLLVVMADQRSGVEAHHGLLRREELLRVGDEEAGHLVHHHLQDLGVDLLAPGLVDRRGALLHQLGVLLVLVTLDVGVRVDAVAGEEGRRVDVAVAVGVGAHHVVGLGDEAVDPGGQLQLGDGGVDADRRQVGLQQHRRRLQLGEAEGRHDLDPFQPLAAGVPGFLQELRGLVEIEDDVGIADRGVEGPVAGRERRRRPATPNP